MLRHVGSDQNPGDGLRRPFVGRETGMPRMTGLASTLALVVLVIAAVGETGCSDSARRRAQQDAGSNEIQGDIAFPDLQFSDTSDLVADADAAFAVDSGETDSIGSDASGFDQADSHGDGSESDADLDADCINVRVEARLSRHDSWTNSLDATVGNVAELRFSYPASAGQPSAIAWRVLRAPPSSTSQFQPSAEVASPSFEFDQAGEFRLGVELTGIPTCRSGAILVTVVQTDEPALRIQLIWPATGGGADLDLHFLHPNGGWDQAPWDCYWSNREPNWGNAGSRDDDPALNADTDWDDKSSETLVFRLPESIEYALGVFYTADHGCGLLTATVRVYFFGDLVEEFQISDFSSRQFWDVARVNWASREISSVDTLYPAGFP